MESVGHGGVLGSEPNPYLFVEHLAETFCSCKQILRDDGLLVVNLGDSYCGTGFGLGTGHFGQKSQDETMKQKVQLPIGMKKKDLVGVPFLFAQAMREVCWWWRGWFPWIKVSSLPDSANDRPGNGLEVWLLFAKSGDTQFWTHPVKRGTRKKPKPDYRWIHKSSGLVVDYPPVSPRLLKRYWKRRNLWRGHDYFYDKESVRQAYTKPLNRWGGNKTSGKNSDWDENTGATTNRVRNIRSNGVGRLRRNVDWWYESVDYCIEELEKQLAHLRQARERGCLVGGSGILGINVPPGNFKGSHYASYPPALCNPIILFGSSKCCCSTCGAPWFLETTAGEDDSSVEDWKKACGADLSGGYSGKAQKDYGTALAQNASVTKANILKRMGSKTYRWAPTCDCDYKEPKPCMVMDPFGGVGSTAIAALRLGRDCTLVDIGDKFVPLAKSRMQEEFGMFVDFTVA